MWLAYEQIVRIPIKRIKLMQYQMLQESQLNKFVIIKPKKMRSAGLVRRFGVKRHTKINMVKNMKIMGSNTKICYDSETYAGGSLSSW